MSPSSVVTRTRICLPAPAAQVEGGVVGRSGMASGIARTSVIFTSEVAEPQLLPALAHPRLVLGRGTHGRREALAAPCLAALELPRARGADQHPVPEAGPELRDVPPLERRARIERRAEDPGEDHRALVARVHPRGGR